MVSPERKAPLRGFAELLFSFSFFLLSFFLFE